MNKMSNPFFEIMQLQPNEVEFMSAVRDSNSNETAYKLGFMHGRSYAAQMADEYACRMTSNHERLLEALRGFASWSDEQVWRRPGKRLGVKVEQARALLAELDGEMG